MLAALVYALHIGSRPGGYIKLTPQDRVATTKHHLEFVKAIEAHDADAAEVVITSHLEHIDQLFRLATAAAHRG